MRILAWFLLVLSIGIISSVSGMAAESDWDSGPIETISGDQIYINGRRGRHVFEALGSCSWCEQGLDVLIRFQGFARAIITPKDETLRRRALRVLVIKDGREEE
jgi:hypothetical protein